jgi:hypothetical protein
VIPADDKRNARLFVAETIALTLEGINPQPPVLDEERLRELERMREKLGSPVEAG